jgi:hypothetical protein
MLGQSILVSLKSYFKFVHLPVCYSDFDTELGVKQQLHPSVSRVIFWYKARLCCHCLTNCQPPWMMVGENLTFKLEGDYSIIVNIAALFP